MDTTYTGRYTVKANVLTRKSDGRQLQVCTRTRTTPSKTSTFIVDKTTPKGRYVSSIYGDEFEYRRTRYGITWTDDGEAIINALRESATRS